MTREEIVKDAARWIAEDGLMGLEPGHFIPGYDGLGTTVPVDNGFHFRGLFELMATRGFPGFEIIEKSLRDGFGGHYRNPGRRAEPITHDDVCTMAAIAKQRLHPEICEALYAHYGSLWKTLRYQGSQEMKNRRRLIYWHSGFLAYCAGKIHPNPVIWANFKLGFWLGMKQDPTKNTSNAILIWVKAFAQGIYHPFSAEKTVLMFKTYFSQPEHPIPRLAEIEY